MVIDHGLMPVLTLNKHEQINPLPQENLGSDLVLLKELKTLAHIK